MFPDDGECASTQLGFNDGLVTLDTAMNYDPKPYSGEEREKRVTIIIEPALSCMCGGGGGRVGDEREGRHSPHGSCMDADPSLPLQPGTLRWPQ